jgi:hypothetical protein
MRGRFFRLEESMPALKNDNFRECTRYAEYCLNMVASTGIRNHAAFNAEWPPNG